LLAGPSVAFATSGANMPALFPILADKANRYS
jgi:hypothetical protein